jgi:phospholipid/cholesterol/gamma-HCH transport system substrate-binding protein
MLARTTTLKLIAFTLIGLLVVVYTGLRYANLGRFFGASGYYVVRLDVANAGGLFTNADVTYRGVPVGRVGALTLTPGGVQADLHITTAAPPIPADLQAVVADQSAVGEQYVDLRPRTSAGPYLGNGSVIRQRDTQLPLPVTNLLVGIDDLDNSIPLGALRTADDQLGVAFRGQGGDLRQLLAGSSELTRSSAANIAQTTRLIDDSRAVLRTQQQETSALDSFAHSANVLARQLAASNADLRKLITAAPRAASQLTGLLTDNNPGLSVLIANLLTTASVTVTRGAALKELLSVLPADVAAGSTVVTAHGARFGVALTFFNPLPCTAGYGGTTYRNGLDIAPPPPVNAAARCDLPAGSGVDVRGSAHAPSGGGVPAPAKAALARLLGLSP